jgi:hypothetical protein
MSFTFFISSIFCETGVGSHALLSVKQMKSVEQSSQSTQLSFIAQWCRNEYNRIGRGALRLDEEVSGVSERGGSAFSICCLVVITASFMLPGLLHIAFFTFLLQVI